MMSSGISEDGNERVGIPLHSEEEISRLVYMVGTTAAGTSFKINSSLLVETMFAADLHDYPNAIYHAADQVIGRILGDKEYRLHSWAYFVDEERGEIHFGKRDSAGDFSIGK
ncbi:hypothetical protein [Shewanella sp.]|uniref:hypothetical protein n=1 Tax=Shewanella sp. TaxID=50422 RepID=UPI00356A5F46